MASALDWTLVRPSNLVDTDASGRWWAGTDRPDKTATTQISRTDVAAFVLRQLVDASYLRRAPTVTGLT